MVNIFFHANKAYIFTRSVFLLFCDLQESSNFQWIWSHSRTLWLCPFYFVNPVMDLVLRRIIIILPIFHFILSLAWHIPNSYFIHFWGIEPLGYRVFMTRTRVVWEGAGKLTGWCPRAQLVAGPKWRALGLQFLAYISSESCVTDVRNHRYGFNCR